MRLNKSHKDTILNKVLELKFPKQKLDDILKELALQLREDIQPDIIDGWEKYDKYIRKSSTIAYHFNDNNGNIRSAYLNVKAYPVFSNDKRFQSKNYQWDSYLKLSKKAEKISSKYLDQRKRYEEFKLELKGALSAITTDKQLKLHMPLLVKHLPLDKQCGLVPVSTFASINKELKGI